ncbi:unnamed protein product [Somion occarium]|uniref:Uncharacterized protein n=1 Tax=Somion occarium TaxID=3059160 RepID=A0ABP1CWL3_9APHY
MRTGFFRLFPPEIGLPTLFQDNHNILLLRSSIGPDSGSIASMFQVLQWRTISCRLSFSGIPNSNSYPIGMSAREAISEFNRCSRPVCLDIEASRHPYLRGLDSVEIPH